MKNPNPLLQARIPKPVWARMEAAAAADFVKVQDVARRELCRVFGADAAPARAAKPKRKQRRRAR